MIHYDPNRRPLISLLELRHPIFWSDQVIAEYLTLKANSITTQESQKWDDIVLFPSSSSEQLDGDEDISDILTITDALKQIKTSKNVLQWHKTYPDLLSAINDEFQTITAFAEAVQSSNTPSTEKKNLNYYEMEPNFSNNLLIAGEFFSNMDIDGNEDIKGNMTISKQIKRHHGRLGGRYVHVFQISESDESIKRIKNLRYINHPHILQILFIDPVSAWVAVEPFQNTLAKWIEQRSSNEIETDKAIMMQITKAVTYLHSKEIIHGNLSTQQIVFIHYSQGKKLTKVAYFPLDDAEIRPEQDGPTKKDDVIQLGIIFKNILENKIDTTGQHLLKCISTDSQNVPPSEAIAYHPIFWNDEKIIEFQEISSRYSKEQNGINTTEKKINILQQWLFLEKYKKEDEYDEVYVYYHSHYNFSQESRQETSDEYLKEKYSSVKLPNEKATGIEKIEKNYPDVKSETKNLFSLPLRYLMKKADEEKQPRQVALKRCLEIYVTCLQEGKNRSVQLPIDLPFDATDRYGRTALHLASHSDDFIEPATKLMKDFGFNPNIKDNLGYAPLHYAVFTQSVKIIPLLLEHHASVNIFGAGKDLRTPLCVAMVSNFIYIAQLLLKMGKDAKENMDSRLGRNALHVAAYNRSVDLVKFILEESLFENIDVMDLEGNTALHIAASRNSLECTRLLLQSGADPNAQNNQENTALHLAVLTNSLECTRLLLQFGADPNGQNNQKFSALHIAAMFGLEELMKLLLDKGADPNLTDENLNLPLHWVIILKNPDFSCRLVDILLQYHPNKQVMVNMKDKNGVTALHVAAFLNRTELVMKLIRNDAKVKATANRPNDGTPLDFAASNDAHLVVEQLLIEGANLSRKGWKSRTPLHIAASCGAQRAAQILVNWGADKNARDDFGFTPMHYALFQQQYNKNKYPEDFIKSLQPDIEPISKPLGPMDLALVPHLTGPLYNIIELIPPALMAQSFNLNITQNLIVTQNLSIPTNEIACQTDPQKISEGNNEKIACLMEKINTGQTLGQSHWFDLF